MTDRSVYEGTNEVPAQTDRFEGLQLSNRPTSSTLITPAQPQENRSVRRTGLPSVDEPKPNRPTRLGVRSPQTGRIDLDDDTDEELEVDIERLIRHHRRARQGLTR